MPRCSRVNIQHVVADDFDFVRKQFDERVPAVLFQSKHCGDVTVSVGISQGETFGSSTWTCRRTLPCGTSRPSWRKRASP